MKERDRKWIKERDSGSKWKKDTGINEINRQEMNERKKQEMNERKRQEMNERDRTWEKPRAGVLYLAGASGSLLPLLPQAGLQPPRNQPQDGCPHNSASSRKFLSSWVYRTKYQSWAPASGFLLMRHRVNDPSGKKTYSGHGVGNFLKNDSWIFLMQ